MGRGNQRRTKLHSEKMSNDSRVSKTAGRVRKPSCSHSKRQLSKNRDARDGFRVSKERTGRAHVASHPSWPQLAFSSLRGAQGCNGCWMGGLPERGGWTAWAMGARRASADAGEVRQCRAPRRRRPRTDAICFGKSRQSTDRGTVMDKYGKTALNWA